MIAVTITRPLPIVIYLPVAVFSLSLRYLTLVAIAAGKGSHWLGQEI